MPAVSMVAPKVEWRIIDGTKRLIHLFTDGAKLWQGDALGWKAV
jgi:hypothetical protein